MNVAPLPTTAPIGTYTDDQGRQRAVTLHPTFNAWLTTVQNAVKPLGGNGATTARPSTGLYIGLQYFDATLGYPVFVKSLNPTVWVNGSGSTV